MKHPKAVLRDVVGARLRPYLEMLVRLEVAEVVRTSPSISAKLMPADELEPDLLTPLQGPDPARGADGLPWPPAELREVDNDRSGPEHVARMREILDAAGCELDSCGSILELGCGAGRMLRCLVDHAAHDEVWGVDINAASIAWCQANLSPPLRFIGGTTLPSLPFDDASFGLVYAGSVFTHISELAESWLVELRRITRPGGYLYLTVQDQAYIKAALEQPPISPSGELVHRSADILGRLGEDLSVVSIARASKHAMVFHDRKSLIESWGRYLEVVAIVDHAFDIQSAVVLRRHPSS